MKCPERSEPLGFGLLRAFFPFICAVFRASTFSTGIGHAKERDYHLKIFENCIPISDKEKKLSILFPEASSL